MAQVRKLMREKEYIVEPFRDTELTSVGGNISLNAELVHFTATAMEMEHEHFRCMVEKRDWEKKTIPVTAADKAMESSIENATKDEIKKQIFICLEQMGTEASKLYEDAFKKNVRSQSKAKYIEFYYELKEMLSE